MPATSFVYEFFIYNSLYQLDWSESIDPADLVPTRQRETDQQKRLEDFIRGRCKRSGPSAILFRAFQPFQMLGDLTADWTRVQPGGRITPEDGVAFFKNIHDLQHMVKQAAPGGAIEPEERVFQLIQDCRRYVYLVRNSIFHGAKTLGQIYERDQRRRIEVYDLFLKCLVSLFFLCQGKSPVGSDLVQIPVEVAWHGRQIHLAQDQIIRFIQQDVMKEEDSRLIPEVMNRLRQEGLAVDPAAVLFYPSAGKDLITPLLLGLPFCRTFYFYEQTDSYEPKIRLWNNTLRELFNHLIPRTEITIQRSGLMDIFSVKLEEDPIEIRWIHQDNLEFLNETVPLGVYFHRGDSWGEGGSGQCWDSDHLPRLLAKIPSGREGILLTDGQPGGIRTEEFSLYKFCQFEELRTPHHRPRQTYYFSRYSSTRDGA